MLTNTLCRKFLAFVISAGIAASYAQTPASAAQQVAAGGSHSCAISELGGVKCWGYGLFGQLGDGLAADSITAVNVAGLTGDMAAVTAGELYTCALTVGGGVKCWGDNRLGELGNGTTTRSNVAVDVTGLTSGVAAISAGVDHICALTTGGAVKCWGANTNGQLGNGTAISSSTAVDVIGLTSGVTAIATGQYHTCALTVGGGVKCWGFGGFGQLGNGSFTNDSSTAVDVIGLTSGVAAIAAGRSHNCAVTGGGAGKCWGDNGFGQLGNGTTTRSNVAVDVTGLSSGVTAFAAGQYHTCALSGGGGVKCWGANGDGRLGDGTITFLRSTAMDVTDLTSGVAALSAGDRHNCVVTSGGGMKCWGFNGRGQLGDGTITDSSAALDVAGFTNGVAIAAIAAGVDTTCVLIGGGVKCWGVNGVGQLGNGTATGSPTAGSTAVNVIGLGSVVAAIAAGPGLNCALTITGAVKCWGDNRFGALGNGTTTNSSSTAVNVVGLTGGVRAIAAGWYFNCALTIAGGVKCWGNNSGGTLGNGSFAGSSSVPVDVTGLTSGVTAVSAGQDHACALTSGGGVKCWGNNSFGQLGNNVAIGSTAGDVTGLTSGVVAISAGKRHTCALTSGGGVKCWGDNGAGQLGDGTFDLNGKSTAVDVTGLTNGVAAISSGGVHTCAIMIGGGLKCWGYNHSGQLGNGTTTLSNVAVDVTGMSIGVLAVSAGEEHTCAIPSGGGVKCWGSNFYSTLGNGNTTDSNTPISPLSFAPRPQLTGPQNPVSANQGVTYTVQISGNSPTGLVAFKANGFTINSCESVTLVSGAASCTTSFATNGPRIVTATYSGDTLNSRSLGALAGGQLVLSGVSSIKGDFNADGKSDLLVQSTAGTTTAWLMNDTAISSSSALLTNDPNWSISHIADFNGDGKADILWRNLNGSVTLWLMNGSTVTSAVGLLGPNPDWRVSHVGDFNGDGKADLLWRNNDGSVTLWLMNGTAIASAAGLIGTDANWRVSHVADFDGDGKADLLWRNTNGAVTMWTMNGTATVSAAGILGPDPNWSVSHTADLNGDGKADLLWRNTNGAVTMWLMNGTATVSAAGILGADPNWSVSHTADFNGDGKADLLWRNTNGAVTMWLMNGTTVASSAGLIGADPNWRVSHIADLNGDGKADLIWRNLDGSITAWTMNGTSISATAGLTGAGTLRVVP